MKFTRTEQILIFIIGLLVEGFGILIITTDLFVGACIILTSGILIGVFLGCDTK